MIYFMLQIMLYYIHLYMHSDELYGKDSWWKYYLLVMYSIVPMVLPIVFAPVAEWLNKLECHPTKVLMD
jgi:hypothetical protein